MNEADLALESTNVVLLTPEGHAILKAELDNLTLVKRPEIAERIRESQQHGEFSEDNSELDEVKFEQAIVESRIAELKTIFGNAQILDMDSVPTDHAGIGSLVKVEDLEFGDDFQIRLVMSIEADPNRDLISIDSPMGMSLVGHKAGETFSFQSPDGLKKFKVLSIGK